MRHDEWWRTNLTYVKIYLHKELWDGLFMEVKNHLYLHIPFSEVRPTHLSAVVYSLLNAQKHIS
jgi:hypothetical protein